MDEGRTAMAPSRIATFNNIDNTRDSFSRSVFSVGAAVTDCFLAKVTKAASSNGCNTIRTNSDPSDDTRAYTPCASALPAVYSLESVSASAHPRE
jgi:hypothetical protein